MIQFLLVPLGIFTSAMAQIMLKKASVFGFMKDYNFFVYFVFSGMFYVVSFAAYAYILKIFNLSKISPVMTVGTMLLVVTAGLVFFKEELTSKQILGILIGIVSIVLIIK